AERLTYFTYDTVGSRGPSRRDVQHDVAVASDIAGRLGIEHHRIEVERRTPAEPLRSVMERNSPRRSNPGLAEAHRDHVPEPGLHLRSNLYEIGRAYYRSKLRQPRRFKPGHMVKLLTKWGSESPE